MSANQIASRYVRRFVMIFIDRVVMGCIAFFDHCHDAPVCSTQPGRRRF